MRPSPARRLARLSHHAWDYLMGDRPSVRRPARVRLRLETLEAREVPAALVYQTDFEGSSWADPAWSTNATSTTPTGGRRFLGEFGSSTATLSLTGLAAHDYLAVSFDLYVIRSWDGNDTLSGPDTFTLDVDGQSGGGTLTNWPFFTQSLGPGGAPGTFAARSGAAEVNTLGYNYDSNPMDSVYRLTALVAHTAATATVSFSAAGLQALTDESWGIDNVSVVSAKAAEFIQPLVPDDDCNCEKPSDELDAEWDDETDLARAETGADDSWTEAPVRYADGVVKLSSQDLAADGAGVPWGQTRSWSNNPGYSAGQVNGSGWVDAQAPRLIEVDGTTTVAVVLNGQSARFFDLVGSAYAPRFGGTENLSYDAGTDTYTLSTGAGGAVTFGGFSRTLPARRGQFESMADASGTTTAVTAWTTDGHIADVRTAVGSAVTSY